MKQKKKQIGINHTREGIGHGRQPSGQVEGEQRERRGRRNGKKHQGAGEEPQHHHNRTSTFVRVIGLGSQTAEGVRRVQYSPVHGWTS
jgi:hypothetical protein